MKKILLYPILLLLTTSLYAQIDFSIKAIYKEKKFSLKPPVNIYFSNWGDYILSFQQDSAKTEYQLVAESFKSIKKKKKKERKILFTLNKEENKDSKPLLSFSPNEKMFLVQKQATSIYRYSKKAYYDIADIKTKKLTPVFDKKIMYPSFSPDNEKIAFVHENNLYYKVLKTNQVVQITFQGNAQTKCFGKSEWLYEEELSLLQAYGWSDDNRFLFYYEFDSADVPTIDILNYDQNKFYAQKTSIPYSRVNQALPKVKIWTYDILTQGHKEITVNTYNEGLYIPLVKWMPNNKLMIVTVNRWQNKADFYTYNPRSKKLKAVKRVGVSTYFTKNTDNVLVDNENIFFIHADSRGNEHIFKIQLSDATLHQVSVGGFQVTRLYGLNNQTERIFFQASKKGSIHKSIHTINYKSHVMTNLSPLQGTSSGQFRADGKYFLLTHSSIHTPVYSQIVSHLNKPIGVLSDNKKFIHDILLKEDYSPLEIKDLKIGKHTLSTYFIKPKNFNAQKKYPVLIYVYGGPGSQVVGDRWNHSFFLLGQHFANQGIIYVAIDGRGSGYRGTEFSKALFQALGTVEIEDQLLFAQWLQSKPWVDKEKIGIWGWSYGGYVTAHAMMQEKQYFKAGVSVAPVTDWKYYDAAYTERFMGSYDLYKENYQNGSVLNKVDDLKGNFLLIHGTGDDNVHVDHTYALTKALIRADKDFDLFIYPNGKHGLRIHNYRYHVMNKISKFFIKNLVKN